LSHKVSAVASAIVLASCGCVGGVGADQEAAPWTLVRAMSQRRSYVAAAELGGRIYVAGGMVGETGRPLATFSRYDPAEDSWTILEQLPEPTRAAAAATLDGTIYVVGGTTEKRNTGQLYAWDGRGWKERAPMRARRFNHGAVGVDGRLFVLGGLDDAGRDSRDMFVYDPRADAWSRGRSLPRPLHAFGAVVFRGEIWVIGGRSGDEIVTGILVYDPRSDEWRAGPRLPQPMELLGAAVAEDEIHAVWESTYLIYDAGSNTWRQGPRPLVARHALKAFHVAGALYTIGGCTTALHDSPVVERRELAT
jgi:N-acetylneuraminic acid mutarotase